MDRGAWQTTVHGVAKSWARLAWLSMRARTRAHTHTHTQNFDNFYLLIGEFRSSTFKIIIDIIGLITITFVIVPIIAFVLLFTFLVFHYFSPVSGLSSASYMIRFHFFPSLNIWVICLFKKIIFFNGCWRACYWFIN